MRNQKGITLVALVITIIVLLILAGVSISLVVGQNGVLGKASSAVVTNKAASVREKVSNALASAEMAYQAKWAEGISAGTTTTRATVYTSTTDGVLHELELSYPTTGSNAVKVNDGLVKTGKSTDTGAAANTDNVWVQTGTDLFVFSVTVYEGDGVTKIGDTVKYYEKQTAGTLPASLPTAATQTITLK